MSPTNPQPSPRHQSGFTLVELLVVIAIIAILAALLLPVLSRLKSRATEAFCLNNQKQLSLGWSLYILENDDALVPTIAPWGENSFGLLCGGFWP
jgi:prepilin-type N-terminal cleavage/methylation domain-containing protein